MKLWPFSKKPEAKSTVRYGGGSADLGDDFLTDRPGGRSYSLPYLPISEKDARNSSIVASVVWWGMRNIVQALPMVKEVKADGSLEVVPNHPAAQLVRKPQAMIKPEDRAAFNYRRLLRAIFWSLVFDGNGYLLKVRNGQKVIGLDWVPHGAVTIVERDGYPSVIERYEIKKKIGTDKVSKSDMIHFTWGIDADHPAAGCSPLKSLMRLVMTDNQIAVFSHAILRNPFPGLIVTPGKDEQPFDETDLAVILGQLASVSGGERGGGIAAFTDHLEVNTVGYSPDDMAIRELSKLPEERICAVFGIPPMVLGLGAGLERSTMANMEQAFEAACENFLVPLWDDLAEVFTESLLPEYEANTDTNVFVLDYSNVKALQEDADALHARAREDFKANLIDRERAKQMIGEDPGPEDKGVYFYQLRPAAPEANTDGKASARDRRMAQEGAA